LNYKTYGYLPQGISDKENPVPFASLAYGRDFLFESTSKNTNKQMYKSCSAVSIGCKKQTKATKSRQMPQVFSPALGKARTGDSEKCYNPVVDEIN